MDQHNKLLAMLQSAASLPGSTSAPNPFAFNSQTPPPPPAGAGLPASSHSHSGNAYLSPLNQLNTGSSREPSASPPPPPPSFQSVSLHDLFRNIQSPQPGIVPSPSSTTVASPPPKEDHHNKLLGMLKTIGQSQPLPPSGVSSPSTTNGGGLSGAATPDHKLESVNSVRSGPASSPHAPVINHPTAPIASPPPQPSTNGSAPASAQNAVSPEPPRKSMFDFVSPFDVFDKPKHSSPVPQASTQTQEKHITPSRVSTKPKAERSPSRTPSTDRITVNPSPSTVPVASNAASQNTRQQDVIRITSATGAPVQELSESEIASATEKIWQVSSVVKEAQGNGPERLQTHNTIDLSKPNVGSLITSPAATQTRPAARLRPESLDFKRGRRVVVTPKWIAYSFQQGRIRLIDTHTGALGAIQLVSTASLGPVKDFAAIPTLIAAIGYDSTVSVWRIPDGWAKEDFRAEMVAYFPTVTGPVGQIFKVEWVKKENKDFLAIGGDEGVIIIDPLAEGRPNSVTFLNTLSQSNKVLKTEGPLVDFCLNERHQAIGLLSAKSQLTLYSLASLNRVWNRQLPSLASSAPPSSVQFCEANILVGRANNTLYELVQITTDIAVLSSIKFVSPSPSPEKLHYSQAIYDPVQAILWIAPFSRGSLYGFKYSLKGQEPIKDVTKTGSSKVVAFEQVAEYPLDSVLSLAIAKKGPKDDTEFVYASPTGVSQVTIAKSAVDALKAVLPQTDKSSVADSVKTPIKTEPVEPKKAPKAVGTPTPKPSSKVATPVVVKTELPSASEDELGASKPPAEGRGPQGVTPPAQEESVPKVTQDDINKALKKTEDRLSNHFRQLLKNEIGGVSTRLDSLSGPGFAADISSKIEKQVKESLSSIISQEIKQSLIPSVTATVQNEVRTLTSSQVPGAIRDAFQTIPKELERGLTPIVQRTLASVVSNSMERTVQESIQHTLVPAMTAASAKLSDQMVSELRSEMLQKELSPPPTEGQLSNDTLLKSMASAIADMQKQIALLSEQVSRTPQQSAQQPPAHPNGSMNGSVLAPATAPAPAPAPAAQTQAPPAQPSAPTVSHTINISASQLEDTFLHALSAGSTAAILQLVSEHWPITDHILPSQPGAKSPLSQAVLLTLLHRLAIALNELVPGNPLFAQVAGWERRTAILIDPKDENIKTYISRVLHVVRDLLASVLNNLQNRSTVEPACANHAVVIRQVLDVVGHKQSLV